VIDGTGERLAVSQVDEGNVRSGAPTIFNTAMETGIKLSTVAKLTADRGPPRGLNGPMSTGSPVVHSGNQGQATRTPQHAAGS
jgi:hypothetical protein